MTLESTSLNRPRIAAGLTLDKLLIVLLSIVLTLANAGKPVHVDDPLYLAIADQITQHPFDPFGGTIYWQQRIEPVYSVSISPPLQSYWLAILKLLGCSSDLALHVGQAPWASLLVWSAVRLSRRWTNSVWPAIVTILSAPVVAGFNLMLDVPVTALCLAGLECWLRSVDQLIEQPNSRTYFRPMILSASLFSAAVLTKYVAVAVVAVVGISILFPRPWKLMLVWKLLPIPVVPALTFLAWQLFCRSQYGASQTDQGIGFLARFQVDLLTTLLSRTAVLSVCWLIAWPIWIALLPSIVLRHQLLRTLCVLVAGVLCFVLFRTLMPPRFPPPLRDWFWYPLFAAIGASVLLLVLLPSWPTNTSTTAEQPIDHTDRLLTCLVLVPILFVILFGPFVAIRSFLPAQLPFVCLLMRRTNAQGNRTGTRFDMSASFRLLALIAVVLMTALIGYADYQWADAYRRIPTTAKQAIDTYLAQETSASTRSKTAPSQPAVSKRYFVGHWGWQFYLEQAGFEPWDTFRNEWEPDSFLLVPKHADPQPIIGVPTDRVERVRTISVGTRTGKLITCNRQLRVHWYGSDLGEWPIGWTTEPLEEFTIYRLK